VYLLEVVSKNESLVARTDCHKVLPPTGDKLLPDLVHRSVDGATSQSNIYTSSPPLSSTADNSQLTSSSLTVLRLTQTVVDSSGDELSQPTPGMLSQLLHCTEVIQVLRYFF
jgi:hypothetical protein